MILTIAGNLGSGKSTVAKLLAKKLNLKHYSTGDFMRQMAEERGITLLELSKLAEKDKKIDRELDARQINLGKKEDNFVIDARLGWHFIPNSMKIFLDVTDEEAARRIFSDKASARTTEKENNTYEKTLANIRTRKESEKKRYRKYYNLDYTDKKQYDLVVDTTKINPEEVVEKIIEFVDKHNKY